MVAHYSLLSIFFSPSNARAPAAAVDRRKLSWWFRLILNDRRILAIWPFYLLQTGEFTLPIALSEVQMITSDEIQIEWQR